jgi:hypothetical protein
MLHMDLSLKKAATCCVYDSVRIDFTSGASYQILGNLPLPYEAFASCCYSLFNLLLYFKCRKTCTALGQLLIYAEFCQV